MRRFGLIAILTGPLLGCGGGSGNESSAPDAGPVDASTSDGFAPAYAIPPELRGRLWAEVNMGQCNLLALYVGEGPGARAPDPANGFLPARLWLDGHKQDMTLLPAGPNRWAIDGLPSGAVCAVPDRALTDGGHLVITSKGVELQLDEPGKGPTTVATFAPSRARVIATGLPLLEAGGFSPDQRYFYFRKDQHPWLWDSERGQAIDPAPARGQGDYSYANYVVPVYAFFAPNGDHVLAGDCSKGLAALTDYDLRAGTARALPMGMVCGPNGVQFSQDGRRAAFLATPPGPNQQPQLEVWDFAARTALSDTTKIPAARFWLGSAGRQLLYFAPADSTGLLDVFQPVQVLDVDGKKSTGLASARYFVPSPDRRFVAFQRSDARLVVWSGESGQAQDLGPALMDFQSPFSVDSNPGDVVASPDSQHLVYWDGEGSVRLLAFGSTTSQLLGASMQCPGVGVSRAYAGPTVFSHDGKTIATFAPAADHCTGGGSALHVYDVATQTDHLVNGLGPLEPSIAVSSGGAIGHHVGVDMLNLDIRVWAPAKGSVTVATINRDFIDLSDRNFQLSDDGNRLLYVTQKQGLPDAVLAWDRTGGVSTVVSPAGKWLHFDHASGLAVAERGYPPAYFVARPGSPGEELVTIEPDTTPMFSPTKRTLAVQGTHAGNWGVFTLAFAKGVPQFAEGGWLKAVSDREIYFTCAEGFCAAPIP